jgi:hypothetical protein
MAEATHTSQQHFGLGRAQGKGPKLFAGLFAVTSGETIDTGLDTVEAVTLGRSGAFSASTGSAFTSTSSISGGTLTMATCGSTSTQASITDATVYVMAVGSTR